MNSTIIETEFFALHAVSDSIYAAMAFPGTGAWSNAGVVDLGDGLLVFDSFATPAASLKLRRLAEEITGNKVKYLVNSHFHGDHIFGNQAFMDVPIISTSMTRTLSREHNVMKDLATEQNESKQYLEKLQAQINAATDTNIKLSLNDQYMEMSKVYEALPTFEIAHPTLTFENKLVFQGSKRRAELHCFGGGHSPSDAFMYLPEEKIAFMGDLATENLHVPIVDPEQFKSILIKVQQMDIATVIPGHGNIGTSAYFEILIDYLSCLIEKVKEAHRNKVSLENFISRFTIPSQFANWKGHNGINRNLASLYQFYQSDTGQ